MKKALMLSAAVIVGFASAGHAEDLTLLSQDNSQAMSYAKKPTNPADAYAADMPYKAEYKKAAAPTDDSLTWKGITLYGTIDMGVTYQSHGAPASPFGGVQYNYFSSSGNNMSQGPTFGIGSNQLSGSFVALKGKQEVADNLYAIFLLKTNFNPNYGVASNGFASIAQNNGLATANQNSFGDSSRNGQMFNDQAWFGLSTPVWGTVTIGRQYALTSDGVINYDPLASSGAFSPIGFFGATAGGGDTEQRIWDNALKYTVSVGPVRFAVEAQPTAGQFSGGQGNTFEGEVGFDYAGFSFDVIGSSMKDAVSANTLSSAQLLKIAGGALGNFTPSAIGTGLGQGPGLVQGNISDNTSVMLLAKYGIGQWKFYGGYENIRQVNPSSPLSAGSFLPGGYVLGAVNNNAFETPKISQTSWIGAKYAVKSDLDVTLAYYHLAQNSWQQTSRGNSGATTTNAAFGAINPTGTCSNATFATCSGALDGVSLVVDWRFAKRFDVYAGVAWSQIANGFASGVLALQPAGGGIGGAVLTVWSPSAGMKFTF